MRTERFESARWEIILFPTPKDDTRPFGLCLSRRESRRPPLILLSDRWLLFKVREVADDEAQLAGSTIALMQNLLPAVPVLLLGFLCLEGKELVRSTLLAALALFR